MCGLAGAAGPIAAPATLAASASLLCALAHRGPDGHGWATARATAGQDRPAIHIGGTHDPSPTPEHIGSSRAALLHTRLAIIDPTPAAAQPMRLPSGRHALAFNGEIYDYVEHRERLARGASRDTQATLATSPGDTAVLAALLQARGPAALADVRGMFAIAWLDLDARRLVLARDRYGIKPLLLSWAAGGSELSPAAGAARAAGDRSRADDAGRGGNAIAANSPRCLAGAHAGGLAFASEIGALLELPGVSRRADLQAVHDFLVWNRNDAGDRSFFADIVPLPAGTWMEIPLDAPERASLHRFADSAIPPRDPMSFDAAVDAVRSTFLRSIELHMRSDVPVGCALSGGIDSSAIAAGMRHVGGAAADVHAFTHVAADPAIDESPFARQVAEASGITLHPVHATGEELAADLPALIRTQGEPFGSTSIYAQFRVFRAARAAGVPVMLDGQGADEMLAGYRHYTAGRVATLLGRGLWISAAAHLRAAGDVPRLSRRRTLVRAGWLQARRMAGPLRLSGWLGRRGTIPGLRPEWLAARNVAGHSAPVPHGGDIMRWMLHDALTSSSLPALLRFEDRNSMAHSVESRVPFLVHDLSDLLGSLDESHLLDESLLTKRVFRQAMRGIVPDAILDRRDKIGFATPEQAWLSAAWPAMRATLDSPAARAIPFADVATIQASADAAVQGPGGRFDQTTWRWISVAAWADAFDVEWET